MARVAIVNLASMSMPGNEPIFPIGARAVQAALDRAGHVTRLIDFVEDPNAHADLSWAAAGWDIIGFSIRNIDPIDLACDGFVPHYEAFVQRVRTAAGSPAPVLVGGGPGYSLFGEPLLRRIGFDVGVVGPGEQSMLAIAADPERYRRYGTNVRGERHPGFMTEVLKHPGSLMQTYARSAGAMIGVEAKRKTCYQECVYCPYAYISGDNQGDLKPLALLEQELRGIHAAGIRRVFFTDAIFNSELRYAKQVVSLIAKLALPDLTWSAYFAPRPFDDEFAELLAASGIEAVHLSPDSLDVGMMDRLGKRFDTRHVTRFIERCRRHNLQMRISVVFGGPGENEESVRTSARYANAQLRPEDLVLNVGFRVLPATALARQLGLPDEHLVEPTFYPFDPQLFTWIIEHFDSRFMHSNRLLHLMVDNIASKKMVKVPHGCSAQSTPHTSLPYLALTRRSPDG